MIIPRRALALALTAVLAAPSPAFAQVLVKGGAVSGGLIGPAGASKIGNAGFTPEVPALGLSLGLPAGSAPQIATLRAAPAAVIAPQSVVALTVLPKAAAAKAVSVPARVIAAKAALETVKSVSPAAASLPALESAPVAGVKAEDGRIVFDGAAVGSGPLEALATSADGAPALAPAAPQLPVPPVQGARVPVPRVVYAPLVASAAVAVISLSALAFLGSNGWHGATGQTALQYCEAMSAGIVKQPANTYSNLGFIAVGLGIGAYSAWSAAKDWTRERANRMRDSVVYPTFYAALATFLGPGSMAMHASTTAWGAKVDVLSMVLWIAFAISYGIARLKSLTTRGFLALYGVMAGVLGAEVFADPIDGGLLFAMLVAALCAVEFAVYRNARAGGRYLWLAVTVAAYSLATAFWIPSHTGWFLCDPLSLMQGHAAWHLLAAVAVWALFVFYRSEKARA